MNDKVEPLQIPDWVPLSAAEQATKIYAGLVKEGVDDTTLSKIRRLTSDQRMRKVWTEIGKHKRQDYEKTDIPLHPASYEHVFFGHKAKHASRSMVISAGFLSVTINAAMVQRILLEASQATDGMVVKDSPSARQLVDYVAPAKFFASTAFWALSGVETCSKKEAEALREPFICIAKRLRQRILKGVFPVSSIFPDLSPRDRAALYRVMAYEARRGVDATTGSDRDSWVFVQRQWESLASKADADTAAEFKSKAALLRTPAL